MKRNIVCHIESLSETTEVAWLVSIDIQNVPTTVTYLLALKQGKLNSLVFKDTNCKHEAYSQMQICCEAEVGIYTIKYSGINVSVSNDWIDAVSNMLIEAALNGWSQLAHIDYEFISSAGIVTLCVGVCPPR